MSDETLLRRMRAQRESLVVLDDDTKPDDKKIKIRIRRPPVLWLSNWRREGQNDMQLLLECVIGWENMTEYDLLGNDGSKEDEPEFNVIVAVEWLADRPEHAVAVSKALQDNLAERNVLKEAQRGN